MTDHDEHAPTAPSDLFSVKGKTVMVTGGTSGIGRMIAGGFVAAGAEVIVASRKADACEETVADLSRYGQITAIPADLSTEDGAKALADAVAADHDRVHVLINNAGATWGVPLADHDTASWDRVLNLNVQGVFHTTKFFLPLLEAASEPDDPARVINIGSIDGIHVPIMETYSYSSSKAAVHQLTRHLAKHLGPRITVNAVAPGPFQSKMMRATLAAAGDSIAGATTLKRIGRDDDMAGVAIFLASRAGSYLTGTIIPVDGGMATTA
jgi:NAD(P)-dependent dehydrogenase (short-subunit alcohol dehydrogenase family)